MLLDQTLGPVELTAMIRFTFALLSIGSLALFGGCQGGGYKPDFAYSPAPYQSHDSVAVLATTPAMYQEVGGQ